ncbi:9221_t:CDS:1, partial [Gigaspora margarita]
TSTLLSTIVSTSLITIVPTSTPTITQTPQYFQDTNVIDTLAILGTLIITTAIAVIYKAKQYKNKKNALQVQIQQIEDNRIANQVRAIREEI